jgi:hypothetical protein
MNDRIPCSQRDHVLVDVKAKPSGWPTASLDPDSGRGPMARSGTPAHGDPQIQVSTVLGDCQRNIRNELDRLHLVTLATAEGHVAQRSQVTAGQKQILAALEIPEPPRFYDFTTG